MADKLYRRDIERLIKSEPRFNSWEDEQMKALFEPAFHNPDDRKFLEGKGVTKEEWLEIYKNAKENKRDIIDPEELEHFHKMVMPHFSK